MVPHSRPSDGRAARVSWFSGTVRLLETPRSAAVMGNTGPVRITVDPHSPDIYGHRRIHDNCKSTFRIWVDKGHFV